MNVQELAGCVIYDEHGKLLLLHRNTSELIQWELPGGKVEVGEEASATAVREIKEELSVDVAILKELGQAIFEHKGRKCNYTWYEAKIFGGKPEIGETTNFDDLRYFSLDELINRKDLSANLVNLLKVLS